MALRLTAYAVLSLLLMANEAKADGLGDPVKVSTNKNKITIFYYPDTIKTNADKSGAMMVIHLKEGGNTKTTDKIVYKGKIFYKKSDCLRKQGEYVLLRDGTTKVHRGDWDAKGLDQFSVVAAGLCVKAWGIYVL